LPAAGKGVATMRKLLAFFIFLPILGGCIFGPNYKRPVVNSPPAWQMSYEGAAQVADTVWWEKFGDPVLNDLIRETLQANRDLKIATARVDQFLGVLDTTRSQFFPQFGYGVGASRQQNTKNGPTQGVPTVFNTFGGSINVNWEIDLWGRIRRATEAARADVLASEEGRRAVILTLVSDVANGYLILRGLDRQLEISRITEQSYGESLRLFRLRYQYGTISQLELSQVESQYESARQQIPFIESQVAQLEYLISVLLGRNPGPIPRGKSIDELLPPPLPGELPLTLLERRPDILQAEQRLISANAQIGAAKALYFPTVSLGGLLGLQSEHLDDLLKHSSGIWSFGGSAIGPLLTFGAISGQVKQAEAIQQQALYNYEQQILTAFREVEAALVGTLKGREQQDSQGRQVAALKEYARVARLQYEGGMTDYLNVLDAERSYFSSQLSYVQTQTLVLNNGVDVYRAMGGGWVTEAQKMADAPPQSFPCMEEIEKYCKDTPPGRGQLIICLDGHRQDLSPSCRERLDKGRARMEEARRICTPDIEKFCPGIAPGQGRILKCLKGELKGLSPACREQVELFGGTVDSPPATGK
jgi:outer membrane protein, multidrug efflux system